MLTLTNHLNILSYVFPVTWESRQNLLGLSSVISRHYIFRQLQLGSDIQTCPTRTRLPPAPARCTFLICLTVFVNAFPVWLIIVKTPHIVKRFLLFLLFLSLSFKNKLTQNSQQNNKHDRRCSKNTFLYNILVFKGA